MKSYINFSRLSYNIFLPFRVSWNNIHPQISCYLTASLKHTPTSKLSLSILEGNVTANVKRLQYSEHMKSHFLLIRSRNPRHIFGLRNLSFQWMKIHESIVQTHLSIRRHKNTDITSLCSCKKW